MQIVAGITVKFLQNSNALLAFHTFPTMPSPHMTGSIPIHEHDIIDLVATYRDGISFGQLMDAVGERYGRSVSFHMGSSTGMDLDGMLRYLESRDKVRITSLVVHPGGSTPFGH